MPKVFISHSTRDQDFVERELLALLKEHGITPWYSKDDIQTASEWHHQIMEGLKQCDWFLVALSPSAIASKWVRAEVHWAMDERYEKFVPVLIEDCDWQDVHLMLRTIQHVDFRDEYIEQSRPRLLSVWGIEAEEEEPTAQQPAIDVRQSLAASQASPGPAEARRAPTPATTGPPAGEGHEDRPPPGQSTPTPGQKPMSARETSKTPPRPSSAKPAKAGPKPPRPVPAARQPDPGQADVGRSEPTPASREPDRSRPGRTPAPPKDPKKKQSGLLSDDMLTPNGETLLEKVSRETLPTPKATAPPRRDQIEVSCSSCSTTFRLGKEWAGKRGKCPKCKNQVIIPKPGRPQPARPKKAKTRGDKQFYYEAMDATGAEIQDTIYASSETEAQTTIRAAGYFVTKIKLHRPAAKAPPQGKSSTTDAQVISLDEPPSQPTKAAASARGHTDAPPVPYVPRHRRLSDSDLLRSALPFDPVPDPLPAVPRLLWVGVGLVLANAAVIALAVTLSLMGTAASPP